MPKVRFVAGMITDARNWSQAATQLELPKLYRQQAFCGARSIELSLKAVLAHEGASQKQLQNNIGHDLTEAWRWLKDDSNLATYLEEPIVSLGSDFDRLSKDYASTWLGYGVEENEFYIPISDLGKKSSSIAEAAFHAVNSNNNQSH